MSPAFNPVSATDMPATPARNAGASYVLGVDGCRAGWIAARRFLQSGEIGLEIADSFGSILNGPGEAAALIVVDMPIGLTDAGKRACEAEARRRIGPRRSSVFTSPVRGMLDATTYETANALGHALGCGLSKQCWHIIPKIREIDDLIAPKMQSRICEGHPEVAFTRLRGAPCDHPKRKRDGKIERRAALISAGAGDPDRLIEALKSAGASRRDFAFDDAYDAIALALTAEALLSGHAWRLGDGARDARGLVMEICG